MRKIVAVALLFAAVCSTGILIVHSKDEAGAGSEAIDARVRQFLDDRQGTWRDLNVPEVDGRALYDIIVEHGY